MLVYHVGFDIIKNPDIHYGRKNADFGQGFYLTDDKEFSYRWAKDNAMKLFMIGPEYKQIVIKSEKALSKLSWLDSKVLTSSELADYHKQMEIEEAEFQELFAKEMEKFVMN